MGMVVAGETVKRVEETVMPAVETEMPRTIVVDEAQVATKIQAAYRGKAARAEVAQARKAAQEEKEAAVAANSDMAMHDLHPQDSDATEPVPVITVTAPPAQQQY